MPSVLVVPKRPNREQQRTLCSFSLSLSFSTRTVRIHALVFTGCHRLSESANCTCLGAPLCLSEQSSNAFTTILLVMSFLEALVAFSQPNHTGHTSSKESFWKVGRNKCRNCTEQAQRPQARSQFPLIRTEEGWMYYEPFASNVVYSSFLWCTLDHLILQMLKQFLPSELRARTSVDCLSGDAFKETLKQTCPSQEQIPVSLGNFQLCGIRCKKGLEQLISDILSRAAL